MNARRLSHAAHEFVDRRKRDVLRYTASVLGPERAGAVASRLVDWANFQPGRPTVLCLSRPHFSIDIEQLRKLDHVNWPSINLIALGEMQRAWATAAMQEQTFFQRTEASPECAPRWDQMRTFARALLQRVSKVHRIDAVLCANIDYWQAEAFNLVAQEMGMRYLVLSRENLLTWYDDRLVRERYTGFRFTGHACAVFGKWIGDTLIDTGCIEREQVVVTGAPRLDVWRRVAQQNTERDAIVLLSFADPNYYAPQVFASTLQRFVAAAARNPRPGLRYVVKAKNKEDRLAVLKMCGHAELPAGFTVTENVALTDLLPRSRLTIGFNTMALFDALFTTADIAVPDFMDTRRGKEYLMFDPDDALCRNVLRFYDSEAALDRALDVAASASPSGAGVDMKPRQALIERYVHVPEETTATELVERFVLGQISASTTPRSEKLAQVSL